LAVYITTIALRRKPPDDATRVFVDHNLSRCSVCSEEMLVNEAIIDVAVSAAKFGREYAGGMPTIGCAGCNGETMAYVEQAP
jgi:hypothetical protein